MVRDMELDNTQSFRMIVKSVTVKHGHCASVLTAQLVKQALLTAAIVCVSKKGETLLRIFPLERANL